MRKNQTGISCLLGIVILVSVIDPVVGNIKVKTSVENNIELEELTNITLKDDAHHKTYTFFHVETWYFDAVFTNNYSMAFWITLVQKGNIAIASIALNIYEDTNRYENRRKLNLFNQFSGSEEKPILKICNKTIVTGDIDELTNRWIFNVSFSKDDQAVDLQYTSTSKGWKVNIKGGWWLVIPRFNVTGTISLNNEKISVSGEGYHDHNWLYTYTPLLQKGWHFGRIAGDTLCLTWAKVRKKRFKGDKIAILNQGQADPVLIDPNDFKLTITKYMCDHLRRIPKKFSVSINNERLTIDAKMEALNTQYVRLPLINYWRYHVRTVGKITLDGLTENIDTVEISEFMKFF